MFIMENLHTYMLIEKYKKGQKMYFTKVQIVEKRKKQ